MIRLATLSLLIATCPAFAQAPADSHIGLLERVRSEQTPEPATDAEHPPRSDEAGDRQRRLLSQAQQQLASEQARGRRLGAQQREVDRRLAEQRQILNNALGDLTELPAHVGRLAAQLQKVVETSLVSAQIPQRQEQLTRLNELDELPTMEQIEALWQLQLEEMAESGRVVRFRSRIITREGEQTEALVTRVGPFGAVADGRFLRYLPAAGQLVEPFREPPEQYQRMARELENASGGNHPMAIDPTGGSLLQEAAETPTLRERVWQAVDQGGVIGWIILSLGGIGVSIALARALALGLLNRRIRWQFSAPEPDPGNPLGRILQVYSASPEIDTETLGLKLDEAILKELPRIKWGLGGLAVLAAIAPLLGLLGTVTGIIETFQAVTQYGTGDPRIMSGGISQALVTTVQGLVVAIPLLLLHSYLSSRSNQIIQVLDEQSAALVARLAEQRFRKVGG